MSDNDRNKKLVMELATAYAQGNESALETLISRDYVEHAGPSAPSRGFAAAKANIRLFRAAIPDASARIEDVISEGDKVVLIQTVTGTHRGALFGVSPSGARVSMPTIDVFRVSGGKIAEHWGVSDHLGLMRQIGAVPASLAP
jgi:predicted ester cyclase